MHPVLLAAALETGSRELTRAVVGLGVAIVLALLFAISIPLALLGAVLGSPQGGVTTRAAMAGAALQSSPRTDVGPVAALVDDAGGATAVAEAVAVARRYLGVPYVFGGTDPARGLDCSGLVQLVFRQLRVQLPRTAQQQYDATARVARDQLQPGDLVFFARTYADPRDWVTHVGVYVGSGVMINAPTTGDVVREMPVFTGFWGAHYIGAGRVRAAA